jgi:hypothetical protein
MKEKVRDGADYSGETNEISDSENWPSASPERNLEGKGNPKWYSFLPWEKFVPFLPRLRYLRGAKAKFSITTFEEINKVCQQVFECHKSFFRFRSQVDLLAHYIGAKILEQIYIVHAGIEKDPLSVILEEQEGQFIIWDRMKVIKDIFKDLCEKNVDGFVSDNELETHLDRYVSTFKDAEDRIKMASIIQKMKETGETFKAKDRVRKNFENRQRAIEKGIHEVA